MNEIDLMKNRYKILRWLIPVLTLLIGVVGFALFVLNRTTPVPASWATAGGPRDGVAALLNALLQTLILPGIAILFGLLILNKQPGQRIGRLLVVIGVGSSLMATISEWAVYGYYTSPGALPGVELGAWITNWAWIVVFSLVLLAVALFPSGDFLSLRWRRAFSITLLLFLGPGLVGAATETPMSSAFQIPNPFVAEFNSTLYDVAFTLMVAGLLATAALDLAQIAVRYRRSSGVERDQLKWLLAGVAVMAFMIVTGLLMTLELLPGGSLRANWLGELGGIMVNASVLAPLMGVGIAMVRHQLYDIDFIIRRTTSYAIVTAVLALVYFGSVVVLQSLFTGLTGQDSTIAIVFSTLLIAALFLPLRQRVQTAIDRRFFRSKYDAQKTLEAFAATVRDETDLDVLTAELVRVIEETMQPEHVSVWLAPESGNGLDFQHSPSMEATAD